MHQLMRYLVLFAWLLMFFEPVLLAKRYGGSSSYRSSSKSYSSRSSYKSTPSPSKSFSWNKTKPTSSSKSSSKASTSAFFNKKASSPYASRSTAAKTTAPKATPPKTVAPKTAKASSPYSSRNTSKATTTPSKTTSSDKKSSPYASRNTTNKTASTAAPAKGVTVKSAVAPKAAPMTAAQKSFAKQQSKSSFEKFKQSKSAFKKPATESSADLKKTYANNDLYKKAQSGSSYGRNYDDYSYRRRSFYDDHDWDPPRYAYNSQPSFGMFDAMFMWMMLDNINDARYASMAHNYRNDHSFRQWQREAELQAQNNAELRAKLNQMDAKLNAMQGQPIVKGYVPEGVDPAMMLASDMMVNHEAQSHSFRVATASTSGLYHKFGELLQQHHAGSFHLEIIETSGSQQNMELLRSGAVHAAVAQADVIGKEGILYNTHFSKRAPLWKEYVHFIVHVDSGIDSIADLGKSHTLYIGEMGSGTSETWSGFVALDSGYKSIKTVNLHHEKAVQKVLSDKNAVMLYVSGLRSPFMNNLEVQHGKKLSMIAVDDWNFNNAHDKAGNRVYEFEDVAANTYENLQMVKGIIYDSSEAVETLSLDAELVLSASGLQKLGTHFNAFMQTAIDARESMNIQKGALK